MQRNNLRRPLIYIYGSLAFWITLDLLLYMVLPRPAFVSRLPYYPYTCVMRESIKLNGVSPTSTLTTNKWGFRGEDPPQNWDDYYTIIAVGGSTTLDRHLGDDVTWTAQVQERLRERNEHVWVGNASLAGHSTRGNIRVMEQVVTKIRPDAILLQVGTNDVGLSMTEDFRVNGNPIDTKQKPIVQYWLGRSSIYRLMQQYLHNCNNTSIVLDIEHLNFVPRPIDPATEVHVPDDVTEALPQLPEFRDNLNRIIDIAQAIDSDILIMTQPSLYEDTDEWRALYGTSFIHQGQIYDLNAADWRRMLNEYNRVTLEVCEARGVACYDLASHIPSSQDYFFDLVHFTEAGAALVAENVAGAVREQLWEGNSTPP